MRLTMKKKKPNITKPLETIAFVDKGSKSLIITIIGFDDLNVAEEFAQYAVQIIENQYINGSVLRLDGGIRLA